MCNTLAKLAQYIQSVDGLITVLLLLVQGVFNQYTYTFFYCTLLFLYPRDILYFSWELTFTHGFKALSNLNIYKSDSKAMEAERCLVLYSAQNNLDISDRQRSVPGKSDWSFQST